MRDPFRILSSTKFVLEKAENVTIQVNKIDSISKIIYAQLEKGLDSLEEGFGTTGNFESDAQLIFIEDAVNFCFWAERNRPKWATEWPKGNIVSGGWYSLKSCFERALASNIPILNAEYLSSMTINDCENFFKGVGGTKIPLLKKRKEILNETGKILSKRFNGKFINIFKQANSDSVELVSLIYNNFPSFRDEAEYRRRKVYFLKRAQIVANDISYLEKKLNNTHELTAFADYKIPQMLRAFGVISYSERLAEKVDNYTPIPSGSEEEIEIRAASIWGIELIRQKMPEFTAAQIDNALWLVSQDQTKYEKPYHRTYTVFY